MSNTQYISCIKIGGVPILPPLLTSKTREECHSYKRKAIEIDKRKQRDRLFKQCMDDLDKLQTKDLTQEHQSTFNTSLTHVPCETFNKLRNLKLETIDISEYSGDGVRIINKGDETDRTTPSKLIRSNSYTLETPSPILLAHLENEARKCVEDVNVSVSPITVIDSDKQPQLTHVLSNLPQRHAKNIMEMLTRQQDDQKRVSDIFNDDKTVTSVSSQSLYYSFVDDATFEESLNVVNLKNSRNGMREDQAASIIGAAVRGYLMRRLLRTEKVQSLIDTIKNALLCAIELHQSDVIEESDIELHRRLIQQVSAACYAFHDVFFTLSTKEQMGIIALDRQRRRDKAKRPLLTPKPTPR